MRKRGKNEKTYKSLCRNFQALSKNYNIETLSGYVKLTVPKDMNFQIRASTSSGRFHDKINDSSCKPNNMLTKYNNGGTEIKIETNSGSIVVED